jgi:hypothetical protein
MSIEKRLAKRIDFDDCLRVCTEAMALKMPLVVYKKKPCFWSQDLLSYKCRCFNL